MGEADGTEVARGALEAHRAAHGHGATVPANDIGLLSLILGQLNESERRIVGRIDANAEAAMLRWKAHELEHTDLVKAVSSISERLDKHLGAERDRDLVLEARLGPARRVVRLVVREWRTAIIILFIAADLVGQVAGFFR